MARRVELIAGIAAAVAGVLMMVYAFFGQTGTSHSEEVRPDGTRVITSGTTSLWEQQDISLVLLIVVGTILAAFMGVAFGATAHAIRNNPTGFTLLWLSTIVVSGGVILSLLSIGLFLIPAVLLAIVATVAGAARTGSATGHGDHQEATPV